MNMKKTFAGAMAGALAVSAMATSASAAKIPAPGSVDIDLTKEAEFYATVQFTFDADYMLDQGVDHLTFNVDAIEGSDAAKQFNLYAGVKELEMEFVGSTGVKTQVVKYTSNWNDVDFLDWYFTMKNFEVPVQYNTDRSPDKQGLYVSKYNTVKEALAVNAADGSKKYPISVEALKDNETTQVMLDREGKFLDFEETNENLDLPFFDKIVVTARIPMLSGSDLSTLNSFSNSYKSGLKATMDGITPIDIFETENEAAMQANADLQALLNAQAAVIDAAAAFKKFEDTLKLINAEMGTNYAAAYAVGTTFDFALAESTTISEFAQKLVAAAVANWADYTAAAALIPAAYADKTPDDMADLVDAQKAVVERLKAQATQVAVDVRDGLSGVSYAYRNTVAANATGAHAHGGGTHDVVEKKINGVTVAWLEICDMDGTIFARHANNPAGWEAYNNDYDGYMAIAETKYTKTESAKVGVKSGVTIDNGTVKTLAGDIGAWKPDALRQIADAIADYEGVTLTFTAKEDFDDPTYRNWLWGWEQYVENVVGGQNTGWKYAYNNHYYTENVKDDYEEWGESMFTGAIVLNRDFSKQFSQSNLVDWGTRTITFDWDEVTEGRFYDASVVLHTLEILSTQNVEWVSCTVAIPEQSDAEVVDPSQGAEDNSNEIDDTPVETDAPIITAAPETEATTAASATEAPAPAPAPNPTTGNAPVALAVIPVALAAAAVVAKKRG